MEFWSCDEENGTELGVGSGRRGLGNERTKGKGSGENKMRDKVGEDSALPMHTDPMDLHLVDIEYR